MPPPPTFHTPLPSIWNIEHVHWEHELHGLARSPRSLTYSNHSNLYTYWRIECSFCVTCWSTMTIFYIKNILNCVIMQGYNLAAPFVNLICFQWFNGALMCNRCRTNLYLHVDIGEGSMLMPNCSQIYGAILGLWCVNEHHRLKLFSIKLCPTLGQHAYSIVLGSPNVLYFFVSCIIILVQIYLLPYRHMKKYDNVHKDRTTTLKVRQCICIIPLYL